MYSLKLPDRPRLRLGVISDTHGLLRPEAVKVLSGSDLIIHAGDIGDPEILEALRRLGPVAAVRGNMDKAPWAGNLPATEVVEAGAARLYVLHELFALDLDPAAAGFAGVIFGHTHEPALFRKDGVLFLNPGSAGPKRFAHPVSLALLHVNGPTLEAELIKLKI
ncbi:MAG: metallophosphoesterase family protein [Deltaproteobacteria bacterium]|nr:metallophosphoesterase family protein [Deltaproteobacteria bacterium]